MADVRVELGTGTAVLGSVLAVIVAAMGGWSAAMTVLVWLLVLDFILGTARSAVQGRLSSFTSVKKTGIKIVLLWALTTFAGQIDCSFNTGVLLRDGVIVFFTVAQGTSILENAVPLAEAVGWTIPPFLKDALEQLGSNGVKGASCD
jgi:toxin secretion/phage lysis holin